jgi:hypothetical protein
MVHTLEAFHAPSAALALADGKTVLIANSGRGEYGLTSARGAISRATLGDDGRLAVEKLRFIEGLNGPVGMTLVATGSDALPAGTLAVTVGGSWLVDAEGRPLPDDTARGTGIVFFDPQTGTPRGRIFLGRESEAAKAIGHAVSDPTAITSDAAGNLYFIDIDVMATRGSRRGEATAGVIKIARNATDPLLRGEAPPAGSVQFAREPNVPTALTYAASDDSLYWATFSGELRRLSQADFSGASPVMTVNKEAGTIVCLGATPAGVVVGSGADGTLVQVRGRKVRPIKFRKEPRFLSPGQPAFVRGADGGVLMILPEQGGGGVGPWRQRVNVIALSGDF